MTQTATVTPLDYTRTRPSIRAIAQQIMTHLADPLNASLWDNLPKNKSRRVALAEIAGTLGPYAQMWKLEDPDAANRIIHFSLLSLHMLPKGQEDQTALHQSLVDLQAAAIRVLERSTKTREMTSQPQNS